MFGHLFGKLTKLVKEEHNDEAKPIVVDGMEIDRAGVLKKYMGQGEIVTVPEGVKKIGPWAFGSNESIREVILPKSLTEIDSYAFERSSLERIEIPSGVRKMGYCVFRYCRGLSSVRLPDGLSHIDASTFDGCGALCQVRLPSKLEQVGRDAFSYTGILELQIPEGMTYIGENAFRYMNRLERLQLPKSLKGIGQGAFSFCGNLKEVRLPEGLIQIENSAFDACSNLEKVVFPSTLLNLEKGAFSRTKIAHSEEFKGIYESVSAAEPLPKPQGYLEMKYDDMTFYYRLERNLSNFHGTGDMDAARKYRLDFDHKITDSQSYYRTKDNRAVLMFYVSVPAFDSEDRQWDSYRKLFLIPGAGKIKGVLVAGGYRVAKITEYEDLRCADSKTEKLLKGLGLELPG